MGRVSPLFFDITYEQLFEAVKQRLPSQDCEEIAANLYYGKTYPEVGLYVDLLKLIEDQK